MKAPLQAAVLIVLTAAATTAVVLPVATATAQQSTVSSAPTPVAGLPDFSQLVEQVGPAVVSVEADRRILSDPAIHDLVIRSLREALRQGMEGYARDWLAFACRGRLPSMRFRRGSRSGTERLIETSR